MKRFRIKTISILLVIAMLTVSSLTARPLLAAEEVRSGKVVISAPDLAEAEVARALTLDAYGLDQIRRLTANKNLELTTDRQPLAFLREEGGQRLYIADGQAVLFLGEIEGQRIYQVFLGSKEPLQSSNQSKRGKGSASEARLVYSIVNVTSQEVWDVVQMTIGSMDKDGTQKIVMLSSSGRQSQYLIAKDGTIQEITQDGDIVPIAQQQCNMQSTAAIQPNAPICGILCGFHSLLICEIITLLTGGVGAVCAVAAIFVCSFGCG